MAISNAIRLIRGLSRIYDDMLSVIVIPHSVLTHFLDLLNVKGGIIKANAYKKSTALYFRKYVCLMSFSRFQNNLFHIEFQS